MRKFKALFVVLVFAFAMTSCYSLEHTVGAGAQGNSTESEKQWYALWGLVPLNDVDSQEMAGGAENYTIYTQFEFVDYIITAFTSIATITVQTVEVQK
jgi:hypothetical protein